MSMFDTKQESTRTKRQKKYDLVIARPYCKKCGSSNIKATGNVRTATSKKQDPRVGQEYFEFEEGSGVFKGIKAKFSDAVCEDCGITFEMMSYDPTEAIKAREKEQAFDLAAAEKEAEEAEAEAEAATRRAKELRKTAREMKKATK